jgi:uncharacterized protein YecE (DUF72 family)
MTSQGNHGGKSPQRDSTEVASEGARLDMPHQLRIGPAGWAYKDWNSVVYPAPRPQGFHEAAFLSQYFDTIEINTSFYRPFRAEHAEKWITQVSANPRFMFTAKLWQRFTHGASLGTGDEGEVRAGFDVLMEQGKLGAVLVQFPFAFHRTRENVEHLAGLLRRFSQYPLVVEFRHASWNAPETFALLRQERAGFCNIDQPIIGRSLEPSAEVTSEIAYVRMHGRRYDTWFANFKPDRMGSGIEKTGGTLRESESGDRNFIPKNEGIPVLAFERYNYLYAETELYPWAERVKEISNTAKSTYVVTNNHYLGKAVVNALQLISILKQSKVLVPDTLRLAYPELERIATEPPNAPTLFAMR